jgi:[acyl-carrier-protein] S-malonyltransferase
MTVRMVVSPVAGIFTPLSDVVAGSSLKVAAILGHIGDTEVRSGFAGTVNGMLAVAGERVAVGQPIAWLDIV